MKNFAKVTLTVLAAACLGITSSAYAKVTLRMGYEVPRTDSQHAAAKVLKDIVEKETKGEVEIKLFPDSTLGNTTALINGVREGTIDMTVQGSNNFAGLSSKLMVIDLPFLFPTKEDAYRILDGDIGNELLDSLSGVNIKGLAFWENGFREIMCA